MTSLLYPGKHLQPTAPKLPLGLLHAKHHDPAKWQRERHQAWRSKIWVPILANTGSVKDPTHSAAGRAHCDVKYPAQSTETGIISPSAHLCQRLGTEIFLPVLFQSLEVQPIIVIGFISVQTKVTKKLIVS